jgi:hypothetical protein
VQVSFLKIIAKQPWGVFKPFVRTSFMAAGGALDLLLLGFILVKR